MEGDGRSAPGLQLDEMDCDLEGLVRRRADSGLVARLDELSFGAGRRRNRSTRPRTGQGGSGTHLTR